LTGDLEVEASLVLTVASRDQARRENRCRLKSLHVRHANSQGVISDYQALARERQHFGDERRWQPQSETRARAEQEPSTPIIGATKEV
jgi:hypothetical protein